MDQNPDLYVYRARLEYVTDGDTFDLVVDLGFGVTLAIEVRLAGVDTAEIFGPKDDENELEEGQRHKAFTEDYLNVESEREYPLILRTYERGDYNRWVGDVRRVGAEQSLSEALIDEFPDVEADY